MEHYEHTLVLRNQYVFQNHFWYDFDPTLGVPMVDLRSQKMMCSVLCAPHLMACPLVGFYKSADAVRLHDTERFVFIL